VVKLLYFVRAALFGLRTSPFVHCVAALTIGVALFLAGLSRQGVKVVGALVESWGAEAELTFYLKPEVDEEAAKAFAARLASAEGAEVRLVSAAEALERLRSELGDKDGVLTNLPKNPLPASIEVRPAAGARSAAAIGALAERWSRAAEVASADFGQEWLQRLERLRRAARGAGTLLLLIVLLSAVVVVAATLQLAIYARREEIEIQKLVGATDSFVKAPFLLEGIIQGLLGASLAAGGMWAFARHLGPRIEEALSFLGGTVSVGPLINLHGWLELLVAGAGLGLLGSFVAVRRFLRV
jgi:cell division transport system permease protein